MVSGYKKQITRVFQSTYAHLRRLPPIGRSGEAPQVCEYGKGRALPIVRDIIVCHAPCKDIKNACRV